MGKKTKALSGASQDAYFRRVLKEQPDLGADARERLVPPPEEISQLRLRRVVREMLAAATADSPETPLPVCIHSVRSPFSKCHRRCPQVGAGGGTCGAPHDRKLGRFAPAGSGAAARCRGRFVIGSRTARGYCHGRRTPYCQSYGGSELISRFAPGLQGFSVLNQARAAVSGLSQSPFAGAPTPSPRSMFRR